MATRRLLLEMPATKDADTVTDRTASVVTLGEKTIVITAGAPLLCGVVGLWRPQPRVDSDLNGANPRVLARRIADMR